MRLRPQQNAILRMAKILRLGMPTECPGYNPHIDPVKHCVEEIGDIKVVVEQFYCGCVSVLVY